MNRTTRRQALEQYLLACLQGNGHVDLTWARPQMRYSPFAYRRPQPSAENLAEAFVTDVGFRTLQLGNWLRSPDGALIEAAVIALLPPAAQPEARLITSALKIAAKQQERVGVETASKIVGTVVVGALVAASLSN